MNKKQGFTLIELLVVVLIIGILSAVALPQYQLAVDKARFMEMQTVLRAMFNAYQVAYLETGSYPDTWDALSLDLPAGGTLSSRDGSEGDKVMTYPNGNKFEITAIGQMYAYNTKMLKNQITITNTARLCCAGREDTRANKLCKNLTDSADVMEKGCSFGPCYCYIWK